MSNTLRLALSALLSISLASMYAQTTGVWRGSVDLEITQSGTSTGTQIYKDGAGIGTDLDGANFGTFAVGDMVTISDPYLFSYKNGNCNVTGASATVQVGPTGFPALRQTVGTFPFSFQFNCGQPGARFAAEGGGCGGGDQEWGDNAATFSFDPATTAAALGITTGSFDIVVTWEIAFTGMPCTPDPQSRTAVAVGSIAGPLPVQLASLTATRAADGANFVTWVAASETDVRAYTLERSRDGFSADRSLVAELNPTGSPEREAVYEVRDAAPARLTYYRLRVEDLDGSIEYSDVVSVDAGRGGAVAGDWQLAPNPVREGEVTVTFGGAAADAPHAVVLADAAGRVVASCVVAGGRGTLDVSQLPVGVYAVSVATEAGVTTRRLVVE